MSDAAASRLILVGRVAGAFGVKGEVRITAYTEAPGTLLSFKTLLDKEGEPALTLQSGRPHKDSVIARVAEIATKEEADAARGRQLFVLRSALPEPEEDEFYLTDLIGLAAVTPQGEPLGRVKAVRDFGAGDVLEIQPASGASWWVAFTTDAVPEVRIAAGEIVVARPPET